VLLMGGAVGGIQHNNEGGLLLSAFRSKPGAFFSERGMSALGGHDLPHAFPARTRSRAQHFEFVLYRLRCFTYCTSSSIPGAPF